MIRRPIERRVGRRYDRSLFAMSFLKIGSRIFGVGAAVLLVSACCSASAISLARVEDELREVDLQRIEALRSGDTAALGRLYADDFMMITSTGEIRTKQDQLRDIASGHFQHQGPPPKILRLRVYGDVAVVESESTGELLVDGQPDNIVRRYTRVYIKTHGHWQLSATHISRVPPP